MDVREDVVEIIAGFSLFADLSPTQLDRVVQLFDEAWFAKDERILRQGFTGSGFYVILDGSAALRIDGVDRATLRAGDYFGEISCLLRIAPTADIVAQGALRCIVLPGDELEAFLVAHPKVMFRLLQGEARKLRSTTKWQS
ncbi:MAG TPA: cyclic nucleotide-binding domain-containing protein [Candidatus Nitrosopolaris sp.]|nr:cyclic nucleotide-binding domain-containing protein [Candidatus Nitrosopolaris sp.]